MKTARLVGGVLSLLFAVGRPSDGADMRAILDTTNGTSSFAVLNAATSEVMRVESDGDTTVRGVLTINA
ncbi:MAG: hypothetical protein JXB04_11275, partial [Kiritimatiellae bacterium]|nr:hypothetical protein [Kiritimatiellia bacterium]